MKNIILSVALLSFAQVGLAQADDECPARARLVIQNILDGEGWNHQVHDVKLVAGHSDRELWEVRVALGRRPIYSYLVNAESMGGTNCQIYGIQKKSDHVDLTVTPKLAHASTTTTFDDRCGAAAKTLIENIETVNGNQVELKKQIRPYFHRYQNLREAPAFYIETERNGRREMFSAHAVNWNRTSCSIEGIQRFSQKMQLAASENPFAKVETAIRTAANDYSKRGLDNNYISYDVIFDTSHPDHEHPALSWPWDQQEQIDTSSFGEIKDALLECVFLKEGAYGRHLSNRKAKALAGRLTAQLRAIDQGNNDLWLHVTKLNGYNNPDAERASPCALRIELNQYIAFIVDANIYD